jgi:hypothetical protein
MFLVVFRDEVKSSACFVRAKIVHDLLIMKLGTSLLPLSLIFDPGAVFGLSAMHSSKEVPRSSSSLSVLFVCLFLWPHLTAGEPLNRV